MSGSIGTIYTYHGHLYGNRARAVAALAGLELTVSEVKLGEHNTTPEFKAKFPVGKVPAFEGKNGLLLTESSAIAKYVASLAPNSGLLGTSKEEAALVDQWIAFVDTEIDPSRKFLSTLLSGKIPYNKPIDNNIRERIAHHLLTLDGVLKSRTYLVGHRITVADIAVSTVLQKLFSTVVGSAERAKLHNLVRYFETVSNQKAVKPLFGPTEYADKPQQYVPPAKEEKKAKPANPVVAAVAAVKEKVTPKKKEAEEDDDDEPLVPEEPKAKNPLDSLPKSNLNLEDWKRAYSNLDTRGKGGSLEWFYDKYDPEGYSIWKVAFKYPEELTLTFMSNNQIGGFFNRLEGSRKYLFGSVGVLGTNNNSLIEGVFIARGLDIKPVVDVAPDWESYSYERIDLSNADQKAYFEAALAWDLQVGDKKWVDGKNFK